MLNILEDMNAIRTRTKTKTKDEENEKEDQCKLNNIKYYPIRFSN